MIDNISISYIEYMFWCAPRSFIIEILEYCGVEPNFKTADSFSILHCAVMFCCFDVVRFLLEECNDIDVNVIDDDGFYTPLHLAFLCGHIQIAQYLTQHGADVYAVDKHGYTPHQYIDGDPDYISGSEYFQNKRKIHHIPYSSEHCYYMKLKNLGIDDEEAISLTVEQFPSLRIQRSVDDSIYGTTTAFSPKNN